MKPKYYRESRWLYLVLLFPIIMALVMWEDRVFVMLVLLGLYFCIIALNETREGK